MILWTSNPFGFHSHRLDRRINQIHSILIGKFWSFINHFDKTEFMSSSEIKTDIWLSVISIWMRRHRRIWLSTDFELLFCLLEKEYRILTQYKTKRTIFWLWLSAQTEFQQRADTFFWLLYFLRSFRYYSSGEKTEKTWKSSIKTGQV